MEPKKQEEWHTPQSIVDHYAKYKNDRKMKLIKKLKTKFEIEEYYEIIDAVGQGAYGIVVAAVDQRNRVNVAIKKIEKAFEHKIFTKRTLRELKICRLLKHENVKMRVTQIMSINTIMLPKTRETFNDLYVVSDLMNTDLASIIKSPQPLSDNHIQFFIYQILRGLKYMHSANIVHRDLKPRNLLVNRNCDLCICDFGLARAIGEDTNAPTAIMTDYVATRWYRAPELLLGQTHYGPSVDLWSVGCILAELLGRKSFLCGNNSMHQLKIIIDLLGTPKESDIESIENPKFRDMIRSIPIRPPKKLSKLFPNCNEEALDLMVKLMVFNPEQRITAVEALSHPFLAKLHMEEDEPAREPVSPLEFEFEKYNLNREQLKDCIYEEILLYHFPEKKKEYEERLKSKQSLYKHILNNDNKAFVDQESDDSEEEEEDMTPHQDTMN